MVILSLVEKSYRNTKLTKAHRNKELGELLLSIAFNYNLKSTSNHSYAEILNDDTLIRPKCLIFQYLDTESLSSTDAPHHNPQIRSLKLENLFQIQDMSSTQIAQDLMIKNYVPKGLENSLFCKVRLATTVSDKDIKQNVVIASMIAYCAFGELYIYIYIYIYPSPWDT